MQIFLTGASGFIGSHVLQALCQNGHAVTCLVRKSSKKNPLGQHAQEADAYSGRLNIVEAEWTNPNDWLQHIAGHDVVINAVGIIREKHKGEFDTVHSRVPIALFQQAAASGVSKIIQISAMGADELAASKYHLSKREADRYLSQLQVAHVVIRPSFVYGSGGSSMAFFARLAAQPVTPVPGDGQYRVQPIYIDDLVNAITISVEREHLRSVTVDAGGGEILTFDRMLDLLGHQLEKKVKHLHIPWRVIDLVASVTDLFGGLGPITSEEVSMLKRGSFSDNRKFVECFGFEPLSFSEGITLPGAI